MLTAYRMIVTCVCSVAALILTFGCSQQRLPESVSIHMQAMTASAADDHETAVQLLSQLVENNPNPQIYFDRARSLIALGRIDEALQDCDAGLQIDPEDRDLIWLRQEAEKPANLRFQGRNASPPSHQR